MAISTEWLHGKGYRTSGISSNSIHQTVKQARQHIYSKLDLGIEPIAMSEPSDRRGKEPKFNAAICVRKFDTHCVCNSY